MIYLGYLYNRQIRLYKQCDDNLYGVSLSRISHSNASKKRLRLKGISKDALEVIEIEYNTSWWERLLNWILS